MGWIRDKNLIAERFERKELPGFLHKEFEVKDSESVVLEKDGEIYMERDHGKLAVNSLLEDFTGIIIIDKSEKTLENVVKSVCLSDGRQIGIRLSIKFRVLNSDHFSKKLMGERDKLFLGDVWDEMVSDVMCSRVLPGLQKKPARDFASAELTEKMKACMEAEIKKKFRVWGLILTSLYAKFEIPESPKDAAQECACGDEKDARADAQETAATHDKRTVTTEEEELSELEKERDEKEVEMALEKKQVQEDMDDALEALELKDIQEKKRQLKEADGKGAERQKLAEDLQNLKKAKEITERKFYKKELSEEAFQHMMEDFEKRIIEIETKLRKK